MISYLTNKNTLWIQDIKTLDTIDIFQNFVTVISNRGPSLYSNFQIILKIDIFVTPRAAKHLFFSV